MPSGTKRGPATYLILHENTDIDRFNEKINRFYKSKIQESNISLFVSRYSDHYLHGNYENGVQAGGRVEYVRLFSIIAVVILLIACINFMNLSTAKASARLKEVGIKKAIGASRRLLVFQYLAESVLLAGISLLLAILFVQLLLPTFNEITSKQLDLVLNVRLIMVSIGIVLFTGLVAGSYPALYLSGFNPIKVLKGRLETSVGEVWARKGLVVFQFTISIILIVAVVVVYNQIGFVQHKNIGYNKENVVLFDMEGKVMETPETFIQEVKKIPEVVNASSISSRMIGSYGATTGIEWEGKSPDDVISFEMIQVNYDLIETLGIDIVEGTVLFKKLQCRQR